MFIICIFPFFSLLRIGDGARQADINEEEEEEQDDLYGGRKPLASHCIPMRRMNKAAQYILTQNLPTVEGWLVCSKPFCTMLLL